MNNKLLLATLAGAVAYFLLGWLVYGLILFNFYAAHTVQYAGLTKNPPVYWAVFASGLVWSALVAYIFDRWANIRSLGAGFTAGLLISFLLTLNYDLNVYAFQNLYDLTLKIVDIITGTVFGAIVASIIAAVLGMGKKPATS